MKRERERDGGRDGEREERRQREGRRERGCVGVQVLARESWLSLVHTAP